VSSCSTISPDILQIDAGREAARIAARLREIVFNLLKRKGAVIGVSGGIDSSVVAFLCAHAFIHGHFHPQRHLTTARRYRATRSAASTPHKISTSQATLLSGHHGWMILMMISRFRLTHPVFASLDHPLFRKRERGEKAACIILENRCLI